VTCCSLPIKFGFPKAHKEEEEEEETRTMVTTMEFVSKFDVA
jgi:hypothetical protein